MCVHVPENLTFVHSLAYVYLFLAHHGDREGLSASETRTILDKILEWNHQLFSRPAEAVSAAKEAIAETWDYFCDLTPEEKEVELELHLSVLRDLMPTRSHKNAVMKDLLAIADADGRITINERRLIQLVFRGLGLAIHPSH